VSSPRLLVLSAYPPSPDALHGGSRVTAGLVGGLARELDVALVYLRGPDEPPVPDDLRDRCVEVIEVPRPAQEASPLRRRARHVSRLARATPDWVAAFDVEACRRAVSSLTSTWVPDLVHVHYQVMGQYLGSVPRDVPRILVVYEPAAARALAAWREASGARAAVRLAEYGAWRRYERRLVASVDTVTTLTDADAVELAELRTTTPVVVIPFGVPIPARPLDPRGSDDRVLFVGNFEHAPNVDAARRLIEEIGPALRRSRPDATIEIVGAHLPAGLVDENDGGVIATGDVAEVEPYLNTAAVVAVPLRLGGGMRVKVVEALAAGKAVVASSLAVVGLPVEDGRHFVLAETDEEFTRAIAALLADGARRAALGAEARRLAVERLGWERPLEAYRRLHVDLLNARARQLG
jgi:glycosyltransferase involved in cell wall biosynthesis